MKRLYEVYKATLGNGLPINKPFACSPAKVNRTQDAWRRFAFLRHMLNIMKRGVWRPPTRSNRRRRHTFVLDSELLRARAGGRGPASLPTGPYCYNFHLSLFTLAALF